MSNALVFHFFDHPDLLDDHGRNLGFSDYLMGKNLLKFPTHYRLVASLEVEDGADPHDVAERLFTMTNSIDSAWFENHAHGRVGAPGMDGYNPPSGLRIYTNPNSLSPNDAHVHRSTSCGDVVVVPKGDDYVYLYCDVVGFTEIDAPIYPLNLETVTPTEIGPVSVVQTDPDSFDLFDLDGECINEGDPIYGRRPTEDEVKGYAAAYGDRE